MVTEIKGVVLLGLSHVTYALTLPRASSLIQLPHMSQFLAFGGSSSSHTQSRHDFVPPAFPPYIETTVIQSHCLPTRERERALSDATV